MLQYLRKHQLRLVKCDMWSLTSNLSETLVRLPRKLLHTPSVNYTLKPVTLRNRDNINHLILLKHRSNLDSLLEMALRKLHFVRHAPSIHLNLHEMRLLLLEAGLGKLGVSEDPDDGAVLLDSL